MLLAAAQSCLRFDCSLLMRVHAPDWPCAGQLQLQRRLFGRPDSHRRLCIPSHCPDRTHHHTCHQRRALQCRICQAGKQTASSNLARSCLAPPAKLVPLPCCMAATHLACACLHGATPLLHGSNSPCLHLPAWGQWLVAWQQLTSGLSLLSRSQRLVAWQHRPAPLTLRHPWCRPATLVACTKAHLISLLISAQQQLKFRAADRVTAALPAGPQLHCLLHWSAAQHRFSLRAGSCGHRRIRKQPDVIHLGLPCCFLSCNRLPRSALPSLLCT